MITSTEFYKRNKRGILFFIFTGIFLGIFSGLFWGFVGGSVGLLSGLLTCFVIGVLFGFISWSMSNYRVGILAGLIFIATSGLTILLIHFAEAFPFFMSLKNLGFLILGIFVLTEIFFWLPKEKRVMKKDRFKHTCKRKLESLLEALLASSLIGQQYVLMKEVRFQDYFPTILQGVRYVGIGIGTIIVLGIIFYAWVKLNERKYSR